MRISDWSSDVCSSDLPGGSLRKPLPLFIQDQEQPHIRRLRIFRYLRCSPLLRWRLNILSTQLCDFSASSSYLTSMPILRATLPPSRYSRHAKILPRSFTSNTATSGIGIQVSSCLV